MTDDERAAGPDLATDDRAAPAVLAEEAPPPEPAEPAPEAVPGPIAGEDVAPAEPAAVEAPDEQEDAAAAGELEELTLPSLVQAPAVLEPGTTLGTDGRLRVGEHLGTRGRV